LKLEIAAIDVVQSAQCDMGAIAPSEEKKAGTRVILERPIVRKKRKHVPVYTAISSNNSKKGFTLIEMVVVLGIVAILVGVVAITLTVYVGKGQEEGCQVDADTLQVAVLVYFQDHDGVWPTGLQLTDDGYIDKKADSDTDCDWGIGLIGVSKNRVCHGANAAAPDCDCVDDVVACDFSVLDTTVKDLWP